MKSLYFVTGNKNKAKEAEAILEIPIEVIDIPIDEVQSMDLEYVVTKKAEAAFNPLKKPLIVDDVGFYIDAWNGFPGPLVKFLFSSLTNEEVLNIFKNEENRGGVLRNSIGYHDGKSIHVFIGERRVTLALEEKGSDGWGLDPIVIPEGETKTIAELGFEHKNKNSHRSRSLNLLKEFLDKNPL